jgi:hypothetical protein
MFANVNILTGKINNLDFFLSPLYWGLNAGPSPMLDK